MNQTIIKQLKSARQVSTPLVAIQTSDPGATVESICTQVNDSSCKIEWDICRGMRARGGSAKEFIKKAGEFDPTQGNPIALLDLLVNMPDGAMVFVHLAHRFMAGQDCDRFVQALWNARDECKQTQKMVVLLGCNFTLPPEIVGDVLLIDEPLPHADDLREIVENNVKLFKNEGVIGDDIKIDVDKAVEAIQGLAVFTADQTVAISMSKAGLDLDALWEEKRKKIEQTPGLKCYREGVKFDDIGGVENIKQFLGRVLKGNDRPNAVVFIDEIEKIMGGSRGDSSGVSQDQLGTILSYMEDEGAVGMIFIGPPGSAKSMVAKAAGTEGGVPTIQLDLGACKGSLVGESERQLRSALKVVTSVSNGKSLWIATCNSIGDLPPELRRRFKLGTFFFDLPSKKERDVIWKMYEKKYKVNRKASPNDTDWTGAEIAQCCEVAWRLDCSVLEASEYVVPVAVSAAKQIARLRGQSDGRFISASYKGVYKMNEEDKAVVTAHKPRKGLRKLNHSN